MLIPASSSRQPTPKPCPGRLTVFRAMARCASSFRLRPRLTPTRLLARADDRSLCRGVCCNRRGSSEPQLSLILTSCAALVPQDLRNRKPEPSTVCACWKRQACPGQCAIAGSRHAQLDVDGVRSDGHFLRRQPAFVEIESQIRALGQRTNRRTFDSNPMHSRWQPCRHDSHGFRPTELGAIECLERIEAGIVRHEGIEAPR